jgi:Zn-finger nucleic acid-binding protein
MIILELDKVEIDHCLLCGGIWLDEGELELLLEGTSEKDKNSNSYLRELQKKIDFLLHLRLIKKQMKRKGSALFVGKKCTRFYVVWKKRCLLTVVLKTMVYGLIEAN